MINVHLNGDIVRCPDISAISIERNARRYQENICKYGFHESKCHTWQNSFENFKEVKTFGIEGRCQLFGSMFCPGHVARTKQGNKKKEFEINSQVYRKISSAAHFLVHESIYKTLFLTLTFPQFRSKHKLTKYIFEHEALNIYFSKFVHNLCENYDCRGYIAVREFGKKNNRVHYHILLSIPFIPFSILNDTWCNCIKNICYPSLRAVTSDPKTRIVNDPVRSMKYVCKYFSKCKGQKSDGRLVFVSNNILQRSKQMKQQSEYGLLDSFKFDYIKHTSNFTICYRITDTTEFYRFCKEFLYPFFELSYKKTETFSHFNINSS